MRKKLPILSVEEWAGESDAPRNEALAEAELADDFRRQFPLGSRGYAHVKPFIGGRRISRREALRGLGDPVDWPAKNAKVWEEFKRKPLPSARDLVEPL